MTIKTLETILAGHAFFAGFEPKYLKLLEGCASNLRYDKGSYLIRHGEDADRFFLIRRGLVQIELYAPDRGAVPVVTVDPGEVLGWSWLVPPYRWSFDARAVETTIAVSFDGKCLRKKLEADHELGYQVLKRFTQVIAKRLDAARLQVLDLYAPPR